MAPRRGLQLLPDYRPQVYLQGRVRVLRCCRRNVEVRATSEEKIRQRVLHWLLSKEGEERILVEFPVHFTKLQRGRADIVVCDAQARASVVVECKRPGSTGYDAEVQAIRYARRLGAKYVWVTDGTEHKALAKMRDGTWRETQRLPFVHRLPASSVPVLPGQRKFLNEPGHAAAFAAGDIHRSSTATTRLHPGDGRRRRDQEDPPLRPREEDGRGRQPRSGPALIEDRGPRARRRAPRSPSVG